MRTVPPGIVRALNVHKANGAIRDWRFAEDGSAGYLTVDRTGGGVTMLKTGREARVFCEGLASAHLASLTREHACKCCVDNECECECEGRKVGTVTRIGEITVSTPEKELPEYLPAEIPEDRIIRGKQGEVLGYVCAGFARAEDGHVIPEGAAGPSRSAARARLLGLGLDGYRADRVLDYAYGTGLVQAAPLRQDGGDRVAIVSCYGDETGVTYIVTGVTTTEEA